MFEAEDFGAELTPELREPEERLRAALMRVLPYGPKNGVIGWSEAARHTPRDRDCLERGIRPPRARRPAGEAWPR